MILSRFELKTFKELVYLVAAPEWARACGAGG